MTLGINQGLRLRQGRGGMNDSRAAAVWDSFTLIKKGGPDARNEGPGRIDCRDCWILSPLRGIEVLVLQ